MKAENKDIIKYGFGDEEATTFFGSFGEPLCFLALIVCVCIIIFWLKYINGDFQRNTGTSDNQKTFKPKDTAPQGNDEINFSV